MLGWTPPWVNTFPTRKQEQQLSAACDEKSIPTLKINILWDMADVIPVLVPTRLIDFSPSAVDSDLYPDPDRIRIQWGAWIRNLYPDPGGQK